MTYFEVLVEGRSDECVLAEIFERKFGLKKGVDFQVHPHQGKGSIPTNPNDRPNPQNRQLLHQLPAKLKGYGLGSLEGVVLVLIDADNECPKDLRKRLDSMLAALQEPLPKVLFALAIEETESWFIADWSAVKKAYPKAKVSYLKKIKPDQVVGAWEKLGQVIEGGRVSNKMEWARKIAPHLDFENPPSPSLAQLIKDIGAALRT